MSRGDERSRSCSHPVYNHRIYFINPFFVSFLFFRLSCCLALSFKWDEQTRVARWFLRAMVKFLAQLKKLIGYEHRWDFALWMLEIREQNPKKEVRRHLSMHHKSEQKMKGCTRQQNFR